MVTDSGAWPCAGADVQRLFGCTWREGLGSMTLVATPIVLAWFAQRPGWIGLFLALLLPILSGSLALLAARALLGPGFRWTVAWLVLLAALAVGAAFGLAGYQRWMSVVGLPPMADAKVVAASFGVAALAMGVPLWHAHSQARMRQLAALRHAALMAELKALQAQVEPHFLFNTLANTRYLARRDPDKAVQMLEHLIGYLHGALPDMRAATSTLGREVQLAEHYLALMAIRFGERLTCRVDCPPELAQSTMPPLMLMTLVENAIKHGVEPQPGAVSVCLSARRRAEALVVSVTDDGAGLAQAAAAEGVGLSNLRERLAAMYGAAGSFELLRTEAGLTEARLSLPLEPHPVEP
jgi:signal transduction histidine kinase